MIGGLHSSGIMAIWLPGCQKLWCMSSNGGTSVANAHLLLPPYTPPPWPAHPPRRCRRRRRLGWTFGNIIENFYRKLCWRCSTATATATATTTAQWQQKQTYCSLPAAKTRIKHFSFSFFVSVFCFSAKFCFNLDHKRRHPVPVRPPNGLQYIYFLDNFPAFPRQQVDKVKQEPQWQETNESIMRSPAQRTLNLIYFVFVYYHKLFL